MSLPITPEMMERAYGYLRSCPPFRRWKLPLPHEVKFRVKKSMRNYAEYQWDGKRHTITLSTDGIGHTLTLLLYMAHEMIHLYLEEKGWESRKSGPDCHNARYRKFAAQVCRIHGFDYKAFF